MRITNRCITNSYLSGMQKNLSNMNKLNTQMTTQKQINKVSDDPYNATKLMGMKTEIQDIERFNYNCDEILGWVETTDDALSKVNTVVSEVKTLLTSISDTFTQSEVDAVKKDVTEKIKELAESLNGSYAGKYIFSGSNMDEKPINVIENPDGSISLEVNQNVNSEALKAEVSHGMSISYNLSVSDVLGVDGLDAINNVLTELNKVPFDVNGIMNVKEDLDKFGQNVLDARSTVGSKANSIESIKSNNEDNIVVATEVISKIEDIDYVEKYVELQSAQLVYNASLQVGSNLLQTTILDFIR